MYKCIINEKQILKNILKTC